MGSRIRALRKLLQAPLRRLKSLTITFAQSGKSSLGALLPRTGYNYAHQVDLALSAPVVACVGWVVRNFPEAPVVVRRRDTDGEWAIEHGHNLSLLMEHPNPYYSGPLLEMAFMGDFLMDGNAYLRKIRSPAGRVVQLWWLPASLCEPKWPLDGSAYISHYDYSAGSTPERIPIEDIVHLRYGLDPANTRKGHSPLRAVLREIFTDDEAANFSATLLRNLGVPGVVLAPKDSTISADDETLKEVKRTFKESFGGDNRGDVMVMKAPTDIHVLSFNPQQMDLKTLRRIPEERISAVLGIPAIVAGLGAGLDRSTFSNMREAREIAYENGIIPLQRLIAAELTTQLLGEFETATEGVEVVFDLRDVRVLQDDENLLATRIQTLVGAGVMMRSEGRTRLGLAVEPSDDVYYVSVATMETGPGAPAEAPPVAPVAPPAVPGKNGKEKILDYTLPLPKPSHVQRLRTVKRDESGRIQSIQEDERSFEGAVHIRS